MSNARQTVHTRRWRLFPVCLRRFAGRSGVALLEFAILAPILLALVVGTMEFAMVLFVSVLLEGGVRDAARFGMTAQTVAGSTREEHIADIVRDRTYGLLAIGADDVEVMVYPDFDQIIEDEVYTDSDGSGDYTPGEDFVDANGNGTWDAGNGTTGAGNPGEVVVYRVNAEWSTMTPFIGGMLPNDGLFSLSASIAVRNEP